MSGGSYYVPATSKWPILGSLALGVMMIGTGMVLVHGRGTIISLSAWWASSRSWRCGSAMW